ncbi:hypothetical protein [Nocardia sp. CC227C]|uniref:terpene synthase family protein n=1 Tax=Nocardia sp. CC227C TaxID=3044562 RepID=UPI00278BD096|nr:hypothetical protein [Nocardia sp. CC227C]
MESVPRELTVYCPILLPGNPFDVDSIERQAVEWCAEHGLGRPGRAAATMDAAVGITSALPSASESMVVASTRYFYWGALLDDFWDTLSGDLPRLAAHAGELQRALFAAPTAPLPRNDLWAAGLRDLRAQFAAVLGTSCFAALQHENAVWLNGQLWYAAARRRESPPEVGEYLRMRWVNSGVGTLIPFTAAAAGCRGLDAWQLGDPVVRAFAEAVMFTCALLNDLFSIAKELVTGTAATNLYSVLAQAEGLDTAACLVKGWQLYERLVALVVRLQRQLLADPRPDVALLAGDLPNWIPAAIAWASTTSRYVRVDHEGQHTRFTPPALVVSETPTIWDPENLTPPPYPEIAWWWSTIGP